MAKLLDGKVAIVSGAGRGLGREEALALARAGARVVVNDVGTSLAGDGQDRSPAEQTVADIVAAGGRAVTNGEDVADWAGARRTVEQAWDTFGSLDILVNNAGVLRDRMSFNMSEDEFDVVMRVHAKGHFALTRHACERWRTAAKSHADGRTWGRIVNTSSEAGLIGSPGNANYAMAKAAIAALTISIGREMQKYGVLSNFIAPRARTRMTESMPDASMFARPATGFDAFHPRWPAELATFLASDAVDFTGCGFIVWGGEVVVVRGWSMVSKLQKADAGFTAEELVARRDELLGAHPRQPGYL
jgi:NAD(P)-dependent dehydrogenase (short-subunit alcohol dehydrogenase family)